MKEHDTEILTSLLDGEPLDARELSACLSDPANRTLLSDLALLRAGLAADSASPSAAFERRMDELLRASPSSIAVWGGWAVAAILTVGIGLVLVFGVRDPGTAAPGEPPPPPNRTLSFSEHGTWS